MLHSLFRKSALALVILFAAVSVVSAASVSHKREVLTPAGPQGVQAFQAEDGEYKPLSAKPTRLRDKSLTDAESEDAAVMTVRYKPYREGTGEARVKD